MSLFTRPSKRAVTWQDVWGSDADYAIEASSDFATFVPVFAATRLLCDAVAQTPLHAYAADGSGRLESQPAFLETPSALGGTTRYDWMYRLVYSLLIRGNAFGVINGRRRDGWPDSIEWLNPADVDVMDDRAVESPIFTVLGQPTDPASILHIPAFPIPGRVLGLSPIRAFASTTEVGAQAIRYGRDWFRNNGIPGAVMKNQKIDTFSDEDTTRLKQAFKQAVSGRDLLLLGRDWDFSTVTIPAEESQFLATIKATANQVAAIYGVPPERVGGEASSSRSYANLDMDLRYLRSTAVAGWLTQIEQAMSQVRVSPPGQFVQFNMDAGIRADTLTRMQAHEIALRTGLETQDEGRAMEDKPPLTPDQHAAWLNAYRPAQSTRQETTTP